MYEELKKKLAEWAGFELLYGGVRNQYTGLQSWLRPDGKKVTRIVFTYCLDACFKWLVPKATAGDDYTIQTATSKYHTTVHISPHYEGMPSFKYHGEGGQKPALALCLAIEKLIDSEAK